MGFMDFRHYRAPDGVVDITSYPVAASQTFVGGEPVVVGAAGTITECGDDPAIVDGIAAHKSTDVDGNSLGTTHQIAVYGTSSGQVYITKNFATDGAGTAATPTLANIGDSAGFTGPGTWYLDTGTTNLQTEIIGVQDAAGNNLGDPNVLPGTGVWVLFKFV